MGRRLPACANASPTTGEADFAEEVAADFERIEPGHVSGRVLAFDVEAIGLRNHALRVARRAARVQREF